MMTEVRRARLGLHRSQTVTLSCHGGAWMAENHRGFARSFLPPSLPPSVHTCRRYSAIPSKPPLHCTRAGTDSATRGPLAHVMRACQMVAERPMEDDSKQSESREGNHIRGGSEAKRKPFSKTRPPSRVSFSLPNSSDTPGATSKKV